MNNSIEINKETTEDTAAAEAGTLGSEAAGADSPLAAARAAMVAADAESAEALEAEWGEDFAGNLELARRAAESLATPELVTVLEQSGLGDHPAVIRAAAEIGRLLPAAGSDGHNGGEASSPVCDDAEKADLEAEIDRLHGLRDSRPADYRNPRTQAELARLYARRYGQAPLVGTGGRRL